jgi:hypothetical protein
MNPTELTHPHGKAADDEANGLVALLPELVLIVRAAVDDLPTEPPELLFPAPSRRPRTGER